jgi:tripartite-type tricarboxylate transporter receptor subunit TctC
MPENPLCCVELGRSTPFSAPSGATLVAAAYHVITPNQRGYGSSPRPTDPIGGPARTTNYFAVSTTSPYATLPDLLAAAKGASGAITVGVAGADERLGVDATAESAGVTFKHRAVRRWQ